MTLFVAQHFLIDAHGKDLADGTDRSALQASATSRPGPHPSSQFRGSEVLCRIPEDGGGVSDGFGLVAQDQVTEGVPFAA